MPELDYNRMISLIAENDKNTNLTIGVWNGNARISVFANRNPVANLPLNRFSLVSIQEGLTKILSGAPNEKTSWNFTKWDPDTKKSSAIGTLYIGRDDKALLYLGISAPNNTPMKFLLRTPISADTGEPMSDVHRSELAGRTLLQQLMVDIPQAMLNTSFKRTDMRSGGNAGGGNTGGDSKVSIF